MSSRAGIVAIVGRANVGKSSLFNAVVGSREAITASEPGTTRDSLTAKASVDGKDFWLVDTAGLKPAADEFEATIQEQVIQATDTADAIIVVVDSTTSITEEDRRVSKLALKTGRPVVLAINKVEGQRNFDMSVWQRLGIKEMYAVSALHKSGLDELFQNVSQHLPNKKIKIDPNVINLALLGRPNVGKSSLFNSLAKKQQAIVSDRAGTTRDVNRVSVKYHDLTINIMDTAGIRRPGKIERGIEHFSVIRALAAIEQADICLLLLDASELSVKLDQKLAGLIKEAGKGLIVVISKWDLAKEAELSHIQASQQIKSEFDFIPWAPLIFTSSQTGENVAKLFDLAMEIADTRRQRIKTTDLNRWLQSATNHHPPAGLKNRQPKLNYIVQEDDQELPSFKIFGSQLKFLHWSYRRYLERSLREQWPLKGTPIKFWFINKELRKK